MQITHAEGTNDTREDHGDGDDGQRQPVEQQRERKLIVRDLEPMIADGRVHGVQIILQHLVKDDARDDGEEGIYELRDA